MAFSSGNIATFTLGATDISQYVTSVSVNIERDIKDIKPIGGSAASKLVGAYSGTISLEGGYDPTLDGIMSALVLASTPTVSTFSYKPSGSGGRTIGGSAYVASFRVDTPGDDTATWRSELAVAGTITDS
jgi:hypothetical protein